MRISAKLALVLSVTIAASVGAASLVFVQLQRAALKRAEAEKERMLLSSARKVAGESLLSNDPLMLVSYLTALRRDRPEVTSCRFLLDGQWQEVKGPASSEPGTPRVIGASLPDGRSTKIELGLSQGLLAQAERRQFGAMVKDVAKAAAGAILIGLLLSIPLSRTLTRRIVRIEEALEEIGEGRFVEVPAEPGKDEISRLSRSVAGMSKKLGELDEMKRMLVASVSHELRSPAAAIAAHVKELLAEKPGDAVALRLNSIRRQAERLEHFVSNMLEMARIERGRLEYSPREGDLGPVVEDSASFFSAKAREAGIELTSKIAPGLPALPFDPDLIAQVLANLLSNAVKFTPKGGTIVAALRRDKDHLVCSVVDSGVGLSAEALGRIFSPFERVPNMLKATGTGLGLAISKAIVETHGGHMGAESEPGKGSRFYFELPLKPASRV